MEQVLLGLIIVASHEREMGEFGGAQKLCTRMRLWELPDQYLLEPTDAIASQLLSINRSNGELSSISKNYSYFALTYTSAWATLLANQF